MHGRVEIKLISQSMVRKKQKQRMKNIELRVNNRKKSGRNT